VSLLLDEDLSPLLVTRLAALFPGIAHVRDLGLRQSSDAAIWECARTVNATIVTADADFVDRANRFGNPPNAILIAEFEKVTESSVLIIAAKL